MLEYVAILGLPKASVLVIDGCEIQIKRDDFVGFVDFPRQGQMHWLTVRAATKATGRNERHEQMQQHSPIAVGFYLSSQKNQSTHFVAKYDPQTEEVSTEIVDETTRANLTNQIRSKSIDPNRILSYNQVVSSESQIHNWKKMTGQLNYGLLKSRCIDPGSKIVPGVFNNSDPISCDMANNRHVKGYSDDGTEAWFPRNIPAITNRRDGVTKNCLSHAGTKHFLSSLQTTKRTELFMDPFPADRALQYVLRDTYHDSWMDLIGDIQLSYILFIQMNCFNSFEHWRDLVAMVSSASTTTVKIYPEMYKAFLILLQCQVQSMENDFFEDLELSENNFLKPSLENLMESVFSLKSDHPNLMTELELLRDTMKNNLPSLWKEVESEPIQTNLHPRDVEQDVEDDDDDDDGPIVVDFQEIHHSLARSEAADKLMARHSAPTTNAKFAPGIGAKYPILFSAVLPHEDVLMTCARALDDASDVSLVREAANYLEEVEARNNHNKTTSTAIL
ncbi:hypothetical protein ACA910_012748 [Epithemia clementina (nom. ined.)]